MELKMIDLKKIHANPLQPRQDFDRDKLQELANSIKEGDLLQPIVVRNNGNGYEIVAGERRFKAFQILKEPRIPAIVREIKDDTDALEKSLVENLQRDDLTDIEGENAIYDLWNSKRYKTQAELAKKLGKREPIIHEKIEGYNFRKKGNIHENISTRTISHTGVLKDDGVRKKVIEKIPASKIDETVKILKEFEEPEQQIEILDIYEQKQEEDDSTFDEVVTRYKEIASGEREREFEVEKDPSEIRFNTIKSQCDELLWITPSKINLIKNVEFHKHSIAYLRKTENHIHKLLTDLGEYEVVN